MARKETGRSAISSSSRPSNAARAPGRSTGTSSKPLAAKHAPSRASRPAKAAKAPDRRLRFAVVGLGHIAQNAVLPAFANASKECVVTALFSSDEEKLRKLSRKYKVEHAFHYDLFEEMCRAKLFDAVYIALPNDLHKEYVIKAAHAGIHVLCEKPMALSAAECRAMSKACADANVRLMIAYRLHFERANLDAIRIACSGKLGELRLFNSVFSMQVKDKNIRTDAERGGGPLWDIGVYSVNAARYMFRAEPIEVVAFSARGDDPRFAEISEASGAILRFPGERLASVLCSFGAADAGYFDLVGTKGSIRLDPAFEYQGKLAQHLTIGDRTTKKEYAKRDQFAPELLYFARCVREGRDPEPGGVEGLNDVRIIEAIIKSSQTGKPVTLNLEEDRFPDARQEMYRPAIEPKPEMIEAAAPHS